MLCYIYKIINNSTGEKYVGQTTNFSRRRQEHLDKLRKNKHPNPKLQAAWNFYGEENFTFEKTKYDISKEELDLKEIAEISKENSFVSGYNLTEGGTGGNTRGKIPFKDFCEIYFGNIEYDGLTTRTASVYNCDSSTVSSIKRKQSYDSFRQIADQMSDDEKEKYLKSFSEKLSLKDKPAKPIKKKMKEEDIITFLSLLCVYGRGIEAAFVRKNNISKGLGNHIKKGEYLTYQKNFSLKTDEEIYKIATEYFEKNNLQSFCVQKIKKNSQLIRPSWIAYPKSP